MTTKRKSGTALPHAPASRMVRLPQVTEMIGLSKMTVYRLLSVGQFPAPIRVGLRAIAWRLSDIEAYLVERAKAHPYPSKLQEAVDLDRQGG